MTLITVVFVAFALLVIFYTNFMTHTLCERKQIAASRQPGVFRVINVCITILLISSYIEIIFHESEEGKPLPHFFLYKQIIPTITNKINSTSNKIS